MAKDNSKYMQWAMKNKTVKSDKDKEMLEQLEQEELNRIDSMKRAAEKWDDEKRDSFKKEKAEKEGIDYTIDLQRLNTAITQNEPVVILSVGTTGLTGKDEDTFFNSKEIKNATREANGKIEMSNENIKNCANDTLTQVSFVYYEKGKDGFYHESEDKTLSLRIPLISVAPAIIKRVEERVKKEVANNNRVFDPFKEGGIDVNDLINRKGLQSDKVVAQIDEYLQKPEIQKATFIDFQGFGAIPGAKKDFATHMISHTYDAVNIMLYEKKGIKKTFDKEIDINLYSAINGYNLTGNRRFCTGAVSLKNQFETLKIFKGETPENLMTTDQKVEGIAYLLNEFCLREMLEKNMPEINLKLCDYFNLFNKVNQNKQQQTEENREKLESLRNEIAEGIESMKEEMEYNRSFEDTFSMAEIETMNEDSTILYDGSYEPSFEDLVNDYEEPSEDIDSEYYDEEFDEDYDEEADLAYEEVLKEESVDTEVNIKEETVVSKETVAIEGKVGSKDFNLYADKPDAKVPLVKADNVKQIGEVSIPQIPNQKVEVVNEVSAKELELKLKEIELKNLEADLKLKEIELAKRELELTSKQPEVTRLAQNNTLALAQIVCKTVGLYFKEDRSAQKEIKEALKDISDLQKEYNNKMFELDEKKEVSQGAR